MCTFSITLLISIFDVVVVPVTAKKVPKIDGKGLTLLLSVILQLAMIKHYR